MSFEEYRIVLNPQPNSPLQAGNDLASFRRLLQDVQCAWPTLRPDEREIARLMPPVTAEQDILFSETPEGLFQINLRLGSSGSNHRQDNIAISLVFAYANPRSVYKPVCAITEWLMARYSLSCDVVEDLAPEQQQVGVSSVVHDARHLCDVLVPSMDYNRKFWFLDAETEEEAILRPGEAVERFIIPLCTPR